LVGQGVFKGTTHLGFLFYQDIRQRDSVVSEITRTGMEDLWFACRGNIFCEVGKK
jgi:hypothetical protein